MGLLGKPTILGFTPIAWWDQTIDAEILWSKSFLLGTFRFAGHGCMCWVISSL